MPLAIPTSLHILANEAIKQLLMKTNGGEVIGGAGRTYLEEHITIQQAVLEGAQLPCPVAVVCVYVGQDSVLLLILMHNNCKENG